MEKGEIMSSMNISETSTTDLEMWENPGRSRVVVTKLAANGQRRSEIVNGGRKFHISPLERRMNQELAFNEKLDVFKNGTLRPVRLIEGTEDAAEIASNPNHMSDSEMIDLLKGHAKTFAKRLNEIENGGTIERLLELAESPEVDASTSRVQLIRDRVAELSPGDVEEVVATGQVHDGMAGGIKAVTPK